MATIKEKISKLLALASSPNEHEAKAALLKAKELMAKYKMSEADFEKAKEQEIKSFMCEDVSWTTDSGRLWMTHLMKVICDEYLCVSSWYTKPGTRTHVLVITGMEDDLEVCKATVGYAMGFVEDAIEKLVRKFKSMDAKTVANSYAKGFISGLKLAFDLQREEHPEWTLMVVKPEKVKKFEDGLGNKSVKSRSTDINPLVYLKGEKDGSEFNKKKVIESSAMVQ